MRLKNVTLIGLQLLFWLLVLFQGLFWIQFLGKAAFFGLNHALGWVHHIANVGAAWDFSRQAQLEAIRRADKAFFVQMVLPWFTWALHESIRQLRAKE